MSVALLLSSSVRAVVDGRFSANAVGVETLHGLPLQVGAVVVAAAAFGVYAREAAISFKDALGVAALAVALKQPYASVTSGTPRPLLMIPLEVAFIAAALIVVERLVEAVPASGADIRPRAESPPSSATPTQDAV